MADWLTPDQWSAVALSLKVSFWATVLSLPIGVATAYVLARYEFWGKQALNGLVHLPLDPAAGGHGLPSVADLRPPGRDRRLS
jgi:ABC-type molybdate transport system permease subunit